MNFPFDDFVAPDGLRYIQFKTIDLSHSKGILHFTHEYNVSFCVNAGRWSIDTVDADGWHDLTDEETAELVKELNLVEIVENHLKERA